jgi:hypothetical protein
VMIAPCTYIGLEGGSPQETVWRARSEQKTSWRLISDLIHVAPNWPRANSAYGDTAEMRLIVGQGTRNYCRICHDF